MCSLSNARRSLARRVGAAMLSTNMVFLRPLARDATFSRKAGELGACAREVNFLVDLVLLVV